MSALADFLEVLVVTQGPLRGQRLELLPWQRRLVEEFYEDEDAETAATSMGRGAGKSTFSGALARAHLPPGPLAQPRGDCLLVASSFSQARTTMFESLLAFMADELAEDAERPKREKVWRVLDSTSTAYVQHRATGSRVRVLGCDPRRLQGGQIVGAVCDEVREWPKNLSRRMYSAVVTAIGKIDGAKLLAIGVQPKASDGSWFTDLLQGEADYIELHEGDGDWREEATWRAANPSYDAFPVLRKAYRKHYERALRDPAELQSFRALRLNLPVEEVPRLQLIEAEEWLRQEGDVEAKGGYFLGIDLGSGTSSTAAAAYHKESGRLETVALFGEEPNLEDRGYADGVDDLYVRAQERGELVLAPGRVPRVEQLLEEVAERWGMPRAICCDQFRVKELRDGLDRAGWGDVEVVERRVGFISGGQDMRAFKMAFLSGKVHPVPQLFLRSAASEAVLVEDQTGNQKLAKDSQNGRRSRARDDVIAASILAVALPGHVVEEEVGYVGGVTVG